MQDLSPLKVAKIDALNAQADRDREQALLFKAQRKEIEANLFDVVTSDPKG